MTDTLALQFAHRSLSLGHSASLRIPIRSRFQVRLAFPLSFCIAYSPLCSGSGSGLVFRSNLRRISPISASLNRGMSNSVVDEAEPKELRDESDFEAVFSGDDYISVCGFGSLLSGMYDWNLGHFVITIVDFRFRAIVCVFDFSLCGCREECAKYLSWTDQL